MEGYRYRTGSRVLNTAASLLLFLIFAVCMLVIIGAGAGIYSRINSGYEMTYGSSAAIRYVSNKIRAADSCEIFNDGKGIALYSGNVVCVIYSDSDGIYERSMSSDSIIAAEGGDTVVRSQEMNVSEKEGLYEITISCDGAASSVFVRKGDFSG